MPANTNAITSFSLKIGVNEKIYSALETVNGTLSGTTTGFPVQAIATTLPATFGIPPQCSNYRGQLLIQTVKTSGTLTTLTGDLEFSLDSVNYVKLTGQTGLAFVAATVAAGIRIDLSGLGGNGKLRLNFTTVTGTAPVFDIWGHIG